MLLDVNLTNVHLPTRPDFDSAISHHFKRKGQQAKKWWDQRKPGLSIFLEETLTPLLLKRDIPWTLLLTEGKYSTSLALMAKARFITSLLPSCMLLVQKGAISIGLRLVTKLMTVQGLENSP